MRALLLILACVLGASEERPAAASFGWVDLFVEAPGPLAAWQIELKAPAGAMQLAGVEGGEGTFAEPPFYDPAALQRERVIVGGFAPASAGVEVLPKGRVRVARLHVRLPHGAHPEYTVTLQAAATAGGAPLAAAAVHATGNK